MGFFNAKWWEYLIPGYGQWKMTEDVYKGSTGLLSDVISRISTGQSRQEAAENSALSQQAALEHAEEREDTAIQRRADDLQAAGINPVLAGSTFGAAESGAAQAQVNSDAQRQQAQAANTQALASLISSAAMLMMTKGRGLPVVTSGGTSAAMMDLLADGRGLSKAEKHAIDTYKMYHKI